MSAAARTLAALLLGALLAGPASAQDLDLLGTDDYIDPRLLWMPAEDGEVRGMRFLALGLMPGTAEALRIRDRRFDGSSYYVRGVADLYVPYLSTGDQAVHLKVVGTWFDAPDVTDAPKWKLRFQTGMLSPDAEVESNRGRLVFFGDVEQPATGGEIHWETGVELGLKNFLHGIRGNVIVAWRFGHERPFYGAAVMVAPVVRFASGSSVEVGLGADFARDGRLLAKEFDAAWISLQAQAALRLRLPGVGTWLHVVYAPTYWGERGMFKHQATTFLDIPASAFLF